MSFIIHRFIHIFVFVGIKLNKALKEMETGKPFSFTFIAFDRGRKSGGQIKRVQSAILANPPKKAKTKSPKKSNPKINPNHWQNQTRSFRYLVDGIPSSGIRKFHVFLVTEFNGQPVFL